MTEVLIAIDQGGQSSRAIAFDSTGRWLARASVTVDTRKIGADRYEQDPEELVRSIRSALEQVASPLPAGADIRAGIATQRSSIVCWDAVSGAALSPIISWRDTRHGEWLRSLSPDVDRIVRLTGLRPSPHYGASKFRWCLDNLETVAAAYRRGSLVCGPLASYLVFRLTTENTIVADPVNASRTLLWDIDGGDWCDELLELFDLPFAMLPPIVPGDFGFGNIDMAGRTVPLVRCTGDQGAAVFAEGEPGPSLALVNAGTGAFAQRLVEEPRPVDRLLLSVARHDHDTRRFAIEGTVNGAGCALEAEARSSGLTDWPAAIGAVARDATDVPLFLNGESGLGSPWWRDEFPSRLVGDDDPVRRLMAVLESVAFMISENLLRMQGELGSAREIRVTGGLGRSDALCRRLASINQTPVIRPAAGEATARGLAWLMSGSSEPWPDPGPYRVFEPETDDRLGERFRRWRALMAEATGVDAV
jgi:glycerol kinase